MESLSLIVADYVLMSRHSKSIAIAYDPPIVADYVLMSRHSEDAARSIDACIVADYVLMSRHSIAYAANAMVEL